MCWVDGIATVAKQEVGLNFGVTIDFSVVQQELNDRLAMCYPTFIVNASDAFLPNYIQTRQNEIIPKGKFEFILDQLYTEENLEI